LNRVNEVLADTEQMKRRREIVGEMQDLLIELNRLEKSQEKAEVEHEAAPTADAARILRRGPFVLDLHARYVTFNDKPVALSPTAFDYLVTLVRHSPNSVSYETLVIESQGYKTSLIEAREIARWRIHELRKALEADTRKPVNIITVRGFGYRLVI
jgi:DNA-binding response OmpR family regulator